MNITKEELKDILLKHEQWLKKEKGGECADLSGVDLSGVDIPKANLTGANLSRAILSNAEFAGATWIDGTKK